LDSKKIEVGSRIKQLRAAREITLREVGLKLGVAANTVNRWERGESSPTRKNLVALSEMFAVDASWLMFGTTGTNTKNKEDLLIRKIRILSQDQLEAVEKVIDLLIIKEQQGQAVNGECK
tara:strand:- start:1064 stop:1423 length:360 start_codon:yes stop_codon:yes gene_type:complete